MNYTINNFFGFLFSFLLTPLFTYAMHDHLDDSSGPCHAENPIYDSDICTKTSNAMIPGDDYHLVEISEDSPQTPTPSLLGGWAARLEDCLRFHYGQHSDYLIRILQNGSLESKLPTLGMRTSKAGHAIQELVDAIQATMCSDTIARLDYILRYTATEKNLAEKDGRDPIIDIAPVHLMAAQRAVEAKQAQLGQLQSLIQASLTKTVSTETNEFDTP